MRAGISDMVAIARHLNVTLVVPELDKTSFWADSSDFGDVFDTDHFINSLRDEVKIVKELPPKVTRKVKRKSYSMPPVSWSHKKYYSEKVNRTAYSMVPKVWSNDEYYTGKILPRIKKHEVLHFEKIYCRLANNDLPLSLQRLRCRVNYKALKFTPQIEAVGRKLITVLRSRGSFVVLHLRYEMDMLSYSKCTHGCSEKEAAELIKMRYEYPWWKETEIDSEHQRLEGLCPLTPEETTLVLRALGFSSNTLIYIASGAIYGGERRLSAMKASFPKIVRKEILLSPDELKPFQNHSTQMAALDYLVSLESDVFIPTFYGNMDMVVEGHRRYLGFRKTIALDRRKLVELLDLHVGGELPWDDFAAAVREIHSDRISQPSQRKALPGFPREEDYFYANPQECLGPNVGLGKDDAVYGI